MQLVESLARPALFTLDGWDGVDKLLVDSRVLYVGCGEHHGKRHVVRIGNDVPLVAWPGLEGWLRSSLLLSREEACRSEASPGEVYPTGLTPSVEQHFPTQVRSPPQVGSTSLRSAPRLSYVEIRPR
jgi:hypothetical protein